MSEIAEKTGIGRATLYKYFPDVESILAEWHRRHIEHHLEHLADIRDQSDEPEKRLKAVLKAYALIQRERAGPGHDQPRVSELSALLHRDDQVAKAQEQLHRMIRDLIADAAKGGTIREDASPDELAGYCIHALEAAAHTPSDEAAHRLVKVTLDGLGP